MRSGLMGIEDNAWFGGVWSILTTLAEKERYDYPANFRTLGTDAVAGTGVRRTPPSFRKPSFSESGKWNEGSAMISAQAAKRGRAAPSKVATRRKDDTRNGFNG